MPGSAGKLQLMGAWEIRQRMGYSRGWVERLISRRDFPEPYVRLRMGSIWLAEDVEAWIREHRPEIDEEPES